MKNVFFQNSSFYTTNERGELVRINMPMFGGGGSRKSGGSTPAPIPPNVFANAFFVDAAYGNNAGAVEGSFMDSTTNPVSHKFQTITAAMTVAVAGDVIIVYPGVYNENTNFYKNGVTYYFYPGCTVTGYWQNGLANQTCIVFGNADFICGTDFNPENVLIDIKDGFFSIEANDLFNPNPDDLGPTEIVRIGTWATPNNLNPKVIVNCRNMRSETHRCVFMAATGKDAVLEVNFNDMQHFTIFSYNSIISSSGPGGAINFQGTAYIKGNRIIGSPNYPVSGGTMIGMTNSNEGGVMCNIIIEADIYDIHPLPASLSFIIDFLYIQRTNFFLKGNVFTTQNFLRISDSPTSDATMWHYGNVYSSGKILSAIPANATASFPKLYLNGNYESNSSTEAVSISSSIPQIPFINFNGALINKAVGGNGISKTDLASQLIFENFKIVTNAGVSIIAPVADTYKVIHSLAKNTASVNATNSIVGSIDYVNAGVV